MRDREDASPFGLGADDQPFAAGDALAGAVAVLQAPADLGPGVDAAVMSALRAAPGYRRTPPVSGYAPAAPDRLVERAAERRVGVVARGLRWLARPRAVRVSPLGALAAAGITIAAVFGLRRDAAQRADHLARTGEFPAATGEFPAVAATPPALRAAPARDTVVVTRFMLVAPGAREVTLVGDFNDWDQSATPLRPVASANGMWTIDVPLEAGRYQYAFLVDGRRWTADPAAPRAVGDDFGRPSSVVTVRGTA